MVQPPIVSTLTDRSYLEMFPGRRARHLIDQTDEVFLKSLNFWSQRRGSLFPQLLDSYKGALKVEHDSSLPVAAEALLNRVDVGRETFHGALKPLDVSGRGSLSAL